MANTPKSSIIDFYQLNNDASPIILEVKIRFRQNAVSNVRINQNKIIPPAGVISINGDFVNDFKIELGKATDLIGKELRVDSFIHDVNDTSNKTGIKYQLSGGIPNTVFWESGPITVENGDIILYTAEIGFFKL